MLKLSHIWVYGLLFMPFFTISEIPFPYIYPKTFFLQIYASIGLLISIFASKKEDISIGPLFLSCLGLFLMSLISSFYAEDKVAAFFGPFWRGTGIVFYFSFLLVWINLKTSQVTVEKFGRLVVYAGTLIGLAIVYNRLIGKNTLTGTTFMGNPNALSFWLGSTIFLNFHFRQSLRNNKIIFFGTFVICSLAIGFLGSRSTIGGVLIGGLLIGLFSNRKILKVSLVALTGLILSLAAQYLYSNESPIITMIGRSKQFLRKDIWGGAWDSFLTHPILGYGFHGLIQGYWENFPSKIEQSISWNDNAHSLLLNVAGEMGILGVILLCLIHFYFIKQLIKKEKSQRASWIGFSFYLFCYCLVQPFYIDTMFLFVCAGFFMGDTEKINFSSRNPIWLSFQSVSVATLLVLTFFQINQLSIINQTRRDIVSSKNYRKTWNKFMSSPWLLDKPGALLEISNQMGGAFKGTTNEYTKLQKPMISFMLDQYNRNFESFSERPRMYENYANWLTRANKYDEAISILDRSLVRSDRITKSVYQKASIYVKKKDYKKAKEMLLRVKELNPDFPLVDGYLLKLKNY